MDQQDSKGKQRYVNLSQNIYSDDGKNSEFKSTNRNHVTDSFHVNDMKNEINQEQNKGRYGKYISNEEIEKDLMNDQNNTIKKKQNLKSFLEDSKQDAKIQPSKTNLTSDNSTNNKS